MPDLQPAKRSLTRRPEVSVLAKIAREMEPLDEASRNKVLLLVEYYYGRGRRRGLRTSRADAREKIRELLADAGGITPSEASQALGFEKGSQVCKVEMWKMAKEGECVSERGRYWLRSAMP